jgi:hypothetical protein
LLANLQQALQALLEAHPGQPSIAVSRVWVELWVEQLAAIQLMLNVAPRDHAALVVAALLGFGLGVVVGWVAT